MGDPELGEEKRGGGAKVWVETAQLDQTETRKHLERSEGAGRGRGGRGREEEWEGERTLGQRGPGGGDRDGRRVTWRRAPPRRAHPSNGPGPAQRHPQNPRGVAAGHRWAFSRGQQALPAGASPGLSSADHSPGPAPDVAPAQAPPLAPPPTGRRYVFPWSPGRCGVQQGLRRARGGAGTGGSALRAGMELEYESSDAPRTSHLRRPESRGLPSTQHPRLGQALSCDPFLHLSEAGRGEICENILRGNIHSTNAPKASSGPDADFAGTESHSGRGWAIPQVAVTQAEEQGGLPGGGGM